MADSVLAAMYSDVDPSSGLCYLTLVRRRVCCSAPASAMIKLPPAEARVVCTTEKWTEGLSGHNSDSDPCLDPYPDPVPNSDSEPAFSQDPDPNLDSDGAEVRRLVRESVMHIAASLFLRPGGAELRIACTGSPADSDIEWAAAMRSAGVGVPPRCAAPPPLTIRFLFPQADASSPQFRQAAELLSRAATAMPGCPGVRLDPGGSVRGVPVARGPAARGPAGGHAAPAVFFPAWAGRPETAAELLVRCVLPRLPPRGLRLLSRAAAERRVSSASGGDGTADSTSLFLSAGAGSGSGCGDAGPDPDLDPRSDEVREEIGDAADPLPAPPQGGAAIEVTPVGCRSDVRVAAEVGGKDDGAVTVRFTGPRPGGLPDEQRMPKEYWEVEARPGRPSQPAPERGEPAPCAASACGCGYSDWAGEAPAARRPGEPRHWAGLATGSAPAAVGDGAAAAVPTRAPAVLCNNTLRGVPCCVTLREEVARLRAAYRNLIRLNKLPQAGGVRGPPPVLRVHFVWARYFHNRSQRRDELHIHFFLRGEMTSDQRRALWRKYKTYVPSAQRRNMIPRVF